VGQLLRVNTDQVVVVQVDLVDLEADSVEAALEDLEVEAARADTKGEPVDSVTQPEEVKVPWRKPSLEFQAMITPSLPKFLRPPSYVTVKLMEATMLIPKPNARPSTSAPTMAPADSPSTAFSALMELCSINSILYATGGSMWIALSQNSSTL